MRFGSLELDHLVVAAPELELAIEQIADRFGVRPAEGGRHPGLGTRNALLALGERSYLEVIAPDPEQPGAPRPLPFGIDALDAARLVTWAAKAPDLDTRVETARARGFDPGAVVQMRRRTREGRELEWRLSIQRAPLGDGVVPFLIDWGSTPSPATTSPSGCRIVGLRALHPEPARVLAWLAALGVELRVDPGQAPGLVAQLETPRGPVALQ